MFQITPKIAIDESEIHLSEREAKDAVYSISEEEFTSNIAALALLIARLNTSEMKKTFGKNPTSSNQGKTREQRQSFQTFLP